MTELYDLLKVKAVFEAVLRSVVQIRQAYAKICKFFVTWAFISDQKPEKL